MSRCATPILLVTGLLVSGCCAFTIQPRETAVFVAHRGASASAPENTIPAFLLAFKHGADFIEGDVRLTLDKHIVCIHDPDTERVTGGLQNLTVKTSTLEQLKALDVGAWKGPKYKGTRIPTLAEVLAKIPDGKGIYIEIKDPDVVEHLKPVLQAARLRREQLVVIAFDPHVIKAVKDQKLDAKVLWLYWWYHDEKTGQLSNTVDEILYVAKDIGADGIDINNSRRVNEEFACRVRRADLELHVYTVNYMHDAVRLMGLGVDSITTDRPKELRNEVQDFLNIRIGHSDSDESLKVNDDGSYDFEPYREPSP